MSYVGEILYMVGMSLLECFAGFKIQKNQVLGAILSGKKPVKWRGDNLALI